MYSDIEVCFWTCVLVGLYPYVGYPMCIALLARLRARRVCRGEFRPRVTVVISAYNERQHIEATVRNKLTQDYPPEQLEVIVASDGSTDGTDDLLAALAREDQRVTYFRQEPRRGKTAALNQLVARARGEIIVFADANSLYRFDAIRRLVQNFADPRVGYVSGRMIYTAPGGSVVGESCSAFMRYENWLRARESLVGSIVGVDGGVDGVRKQLYRTMRDDQLPDFVLPLEVVEQRQRVIYEPSAILEEDALTTQSSEYRMRVRVALRAYWALWDKRVLLNPMRYPLFAWQLASHKLLRYLSFIPLGVAGILNWTLLSKGGVYGVLAAGQVCFAALAIGAPFGRDTFGRISACRYCSYFLLLNWASAVAFSRFLRGQKQIIWQPRTG